MRLGKLLTALIVVVLAACGVLVERRVSPRWPVAVGVSIGGHRMPDDIRSLPRWIENLRERAQARRISFRHGSSVFDTTLEAAGVAFDADATLSQARKIGREGSLWRRLSDTEKARAGMIDVPIVWSIDVSRAEALFATFAPVLAVPPVDARLDVAAHRRVPDEAGRALDVEASLEELRHATHEEDETIDLLMRRMPAKVRTEDLARVDVESVLASYETTFLTFGSGAARAANIRRAAERLTAPCFFLATSYLLTMS